MGRPTHCGSPSQPRKGGLQSGWCYFHYHRKRPSRHHLHAIACRWKQDRLGRRVQLPSLAIMRQGASRTLEFQDDMSLPSDTVSFLTIEKLLANGMITATLCP